MPTNDKEVFVVDLDLFSVHIGWGYEGFRTKRSLLTGRIREGVMGWLDLLLVCVVSYSAFV